MSEFNNRIDAQRKTLRVVNANKMFVEPLFGLSTSAINRWLTSNQINRNEKFVTLIETVSKKLFFLANKSQEAITDDYQKLSKEVISLVEEIDVEMAR